MNTKSKKGFTLVEIMIVVVIIGLLAAMAIPAFQRVRENSISSRMDNDARQLASAAQQYFLEENVSTVSVTYDPANGEITGLTGYLNAIGRGYDYFISTTTGGSSTTASMTPTDDFHMGHPLIGNAGAADREYNPEGQNID